MTHQVHVNTRFTACVCDLTCIVIFTRRGLIGIFRYSLLGGLVAPVTQILTWISGMDLMKEEALTGGDCLLVLHGSRNGRYPVKLPVSQISPQRAFLRGCCRASYLLCLFLSLPISFIFPHSSFLPHHLPRSCLLWCCLLSGTSAVKSPSVLNSFLISPPFTDWLWKSITRLRQTSAI